MSSPDVLWEEFFNRLTAKTYYRPVSLENDICGDLTPFREEIATRHKGIYANVLSAQKILNEGGLELLDNVVYCISKNFGMPKLKTDKENGTVNLAELEKSQHSIAETITVAEGEQLVFFNWNKSIILCEGFHIKEISQSRATIKFAEMQEGLYNYIFVCFATESKKEYKLYMAEAQPLEIGSKHWNIMAKVNQDLQDQNKGVADTRLVIITAGEIDLTSKNLLFNFFSGTIFTKILQGECEVITGLNYDEDTDERCHSVIYDYFLVPYMLAIFERCDENKDFSFFYTRDHLIDPKKLRDKGIIFDLAYYEKLKGLPQNEDCKINFDKPE